MRGPIPYQVGNGVSLGHPMYVERVADQRMMDALRNRQIGYLLGTRQIGKTSLRFRLEHALEQDGFRLVSLSLQEFGCPSEDQFYSALIQQTALQLKLLWDKAAFDKRHAASSPVNRWMSFFREVVARLRDDPVVVLIDEIDLVLHQDFVKLSTDAFFGSIRWLHRQSPTFEGRKERFSLTFFLSGVALPGDLIQDPINSPFDVESFTERLDDFSKDQLGPLIAPLLTLGFDEKAWKDAIYHWTSGHPYMTQRLCKEIWLQGDHLDGSPAARASAAVQSAFPSDHPDPNVGFAEAKFKEFYQRFNNASAATLYRRIYTGAPVLYEPQDREQNFLLLSGMVKVIRRGNSQRMLVMRNRIFKEAFGKKWILEHDPLPPELFDRLLKYRQERGQSWDDRSLSGLQTAISMSLGAIKPTSLSRRLLGSIGDLWPNDRLLTGTEIDRTLTHFARNTQPMPADVLELLLHSQRVRSKQEKFGTYFFALILIVFVATPIGGWIHVHLTGIHLAKDARKDSLIKEKDSLIKEKNLSLEEKNAKISELSDFKEKATKKIADLEQQIADLQDAIDTLTAGINETSALLDQKQNELAAVQGNHQQLQDEVDRLARLLENQKRLRGRDQHRKQQGERQRREQQDELDKTIAKLAALSKTAVEPERGPIQKLVDAIKAMGPSLSANNDGTSDQGVNLRAALTAARSQIEWKPLPFQTLSKSASMLQLCPQNQDVAGQPLVLAAGHDRVAQLLDVTGSRLRQFSIGMNVGAVAPKYKCGQFWLVGPEGQLQLWDTASNSVLVRRSLGVAISVLGVAETPDADQPNGIPIISASGKEAKVRFERSGKIIEGATLRHVDPVRAVSLSPDGQHILTAGGHSAILWDAVTGKLDRIVATHHDDVINSLSFGTHDNGQTIVTASADETAATWALDGKMRKLATFEGHSDEVRSALLSSDGRYLVTASDDRSVCIWNASNGRSLYTISNLGSAAQYAAFSTSGHYLAVLLKNGEARLYGTSNRNFFKLACASLLHRTEYAQVRSDCEAIP